jgi:hypothetical protein
MRRLSLLARIALAPCVALALLASGQPSAANSPAVVDQEFPFTVGFVNCDGTLMVLEGFSHFKVRVDFDALTGELHGAIEENFHDIVVVSPVARYVATYGQTTVANGDFYGMAPYTFIHQEQFLLTRSGEVTVLGVSVPDDLRIWTRVQATFNGNGTPTATQTEGGADCR